MNKMEYRRIIEQKKRANPERKARVLKKLLKVRFLRIDTIFLENSI